MITELDLSFEIYIHLNGSPFDQHIVQIQIVDRIVHSFVYSLIETDVETSSSIRELNLQLFVNKASDC